MIRNDPDDDDYGPPEYGVRSSDIGSFIPEGSYRPLPIVWCAGAWLIQIFVLPWVWILTLRAPPTVGALCAGLISFWIAHWTWRRGMARSSWAWQIATAALMVINLAAIVMLIFTERAEASIA